MKITAKRLGTAPAVVLLVAALALGAACTGSSPPGAHEEHGSKAAHGDKKAVRLTGEQMKEFGIEVATAGSGPLTVQVELPGEIVVNADRVAHVVPRVPGVVREVRKVLGDRVRNGEILMVLDSKELADNKAAFLSAHEKLALARSNFEREEELWKKRISPAQDYLQARQALAEARIELRSAEQKLHALGFSDAYLARLPSLPDESYTRYEIAAPFDGTIIGKHVALGEAHKEDAEAFLIADLSTVWVNLSVFQGDLPSIRKGQAVVVSAGHGIPDMRGEISYVGPLVGEQTRTATARVVLPNRGGQLRPGLFVTGKITLGIVPVPILVPKSALQTVEEKTVVFVRGEDGFEPREVGVGRTNGTHAEVVSGLAAGERFVTVGAFTLKAQLAKGSFGEDHDH